jgi:hypothetical protein
VYKVITFCLLGGHLSAANNIPPDSVHLGYRPLSVREHLRQRRRDQAGGVGFMMAYFRGKSLYTSQKRIRIPLASLIIRYGFTDIFALLGRPKRAVPVAVSIVRRGTPYKLLPGSARAPTLVIEQIVTIGIISTKQTTPKTISTLVLGLRLRSTGSWLVTSR